jgi:polar amino acid transport system substrate-binding protein
MGSSRGWGNGRRDRLAQATVSVLATALLLAVVLGLAKVLDSADVTAQAQTTDFHSRLPQPIQAAGKLIVGTAPTYAPLEYKDPASNELQGLDIDLGNEIGRRLGVRVEWVEQGFEQLITSLDTGRIDMGASGMTDIASRRQKTDFVDYFATGTQLFSMPAAGAALHRVEDVCGRPVAVNRNGIFYIRLSEFNERVCVKQGRPAIQFSLTDKTADARLQIIQGRVVAAVQGVDAIRYLNESATSADRGKFILIGNPISVDLAGFGFVKTETGLRDLVADVVTEMIRDGSYDKIFRKWELPYSEVRAVSINGEPRLK